MKFYKIPLSPDNQEFTLQLDNSTLYCRLLYRDEAGWVLDMEGVASGIPLIPNVNLLEQYPEISSNGSLALIGEEGTEEYPDQNSLGISHNLYLIREHK